MIARFMQNLDPTCGLAYYKAGFSKCNIYNFAAPAGIAIIGVK